jgi:hypothetical protein
MDLEAPRPQVIRRGPTYAQIAWNPVPGATFYQVARYDPATRAVLGPTGPISGTSYLVSGLNPFGPTYLVVRSGDAQTVSDWSAPISV